MKKSAIIIGFVIILALLVFGVLEKTLSGTVGNLGVIIMYAVIAVILAVMYVRTSRQAKEEERFAALINLLVDSGKSDLLKEAATNKSLRRRLYKEYNIK